MTRASVTIRQLRAHLRAHLERVRRGHEILVLDRDQPVARIIPYEESADVDAQTRGLIARGRLLPPRKEMDWDAFDRLPIPRVRGNALLDAVVANRAEDER